MLDKLGLIPEYITDAWKTKHNRYPIDGTIRNRMKRFTSSGFLSLLLVIILISMPLFPTIVLSDRFSVIFTLVLLISALGVCAWNSRPSSFTRDLDKLRRLVQNNWRMFLGLQEDQMKARVITVLTLMARSIKSAEDEFDAGSPRIIDLREDFKKAHRVCLAFGLACPDWNPYFEGTLVSPLAADPSRDRSRQNRHLPHLRQVKDDYLSLNPGAVLQQPGLFVD